MYISVMTSCIEDDAEEECILSTALDMDIKFNFILWKKTAECLKPRWKMRRSTGWAWYISKVCIKYVSCEKQILFIKFDNEHYSKTKTKFATLFRFSRFFL